ncbi:sigma-54 interaction domain-containing protein [Methyloversatilis sp.]|uniref:sigma-54 interaction domain-containing protein n=1 Tax=Methyloversatilis sp. TaxID=2569862 RepID=UPI0035B16BD5
MPPTEPLHSGHPLVRPPPRRLVACVVAAAIASMGLAGFVHLRTRSLEQATSQLYTMRLPALEAVSSLRGPITAQQTILFRYYASRNRAEFQSSYRDNHRRILEQLDRLDSSTNSRNADICRIGLGEVEALAGRLVDVLDRPSPDPVESMALLAEVQMQAERMTDELNAVVNAIRGEFSASVEHTHAASRQIARLVYAYTGFLLLMGTLVALTLRRYFEASAQQRSIALFPERNPSAVLCLDRRGAIRYANPGAHALLSRLGHAADGPGALLPPDLGARLDALVAAAPEPVDWEYALGDHTLLCSAHFVAEEEVFHAYPVDVSAQRAAQRALNTALEEVRSLGKRLADENVYLKAEIESAVPSSDIVGQSARLREVLARVGEVAATSATVLILGESGVGKESLARAIHDRSARALRPFIKLNCAAIAPTLVESELFGHEKGAFTGAAARRLGRFELADGGTLFLDEIGELPPDVQAALLRVLQEQEFERVGGQDTVRVDVRIVAATNRDLKHMVDEGRFRADLYYRINVFPVTLPPLRERREDIPSLAAHFLKKFSLTHGKQVTGVSASALEHLQSWDWPGNIRELQNVIERAVILCQGEVLEVPALGFSTPVSVSRASTPASSLQSVERAHIVQVLERHGWVIEGRRGAAAALGMPPGTLRSRMKKLAIERPARAPEVTR